jgi:adenylosuccinate lyase
MNASNTVLERTLDDSAARRIAIPEAFLAVDECLAIYERLTRGIRLYPAMIARNLERFGAFSGTEAVMMELVEKGEDRQAVHELIRVKSFEAWESVMQGKPNPLEVLLANDAVVGSRLTKGRIKELLDPSAHTGGAAESCDEFLRKVVGPMLAGRKKAGRTKVTY